MNFKGNISFANNDPVGHPDDGTFSLTSSGTVDGTATFVREAGSSWNFREIPTSTLATGAASCTSAGGPNGHSTIRNPDPNPARPEGVDVDLVDGDVVTCTFTNTFIPPVGLVVRKITRGGSGSFPIDVSGFAPFTLTTSATGTPARADVGRRSPGSTHTITETLPASDAGTWVAESAACGGSTVAVVRRSRTAQIEVTMPQTGSQVCTFTNRFIPNGVIRIRKVTRGGTASATFYVQPEFGTPTRFVQTATTTAPEVPALARPQSSADATNRLPLGVYSIQELSPFEENGRTWNLVAVVCDGFVPEASSSGAIEVTLTEADPEVDCTFTDELASVPAPLPPLPTPVPVPPVITQLPPPGIQVAGIIERSAPVPQADLVVTKAATPRVVTLGRPVSYLVTVHNRGPATAKDVTLVERQTAITRFLRLQPSKGHCPARSRGSARSARCEPARPRRCG